MTRLFLYQTIVFSLLGLSWAACGNGLEPDFRAESANARGRFRGTITFRNWPPPVPDSLQPDSLRELLFVVYRTPPSAALFLDPNNLADTIFLRRAFYRPTFQIDREIAAGTYQYVAVAQQFRGFVLDPNNWRPVGVFGGSPSNPTGAPMVIQPNQITTNVDIDVDFWRPLPFPR
ncbi:MAG: hypothetical protein HY22_10870 [[Candidatus Thermochlorobacteriaceae] bacterium GBChlB]|nr:MAG: hypothetical protein HY22_10870 [[Candidatus Thermochlorobacteriaceae] bacterium GBChlB]